MSDINMDSGAPVAALGASQDAQAAAFAADPRIHFSTVTRRWAFEDDGGNEWEYDANKGAWIQVVRGSLEFHITLMPDLGCK